MEASLHWGELPRAFDEEGSMIFTGNRIGAARLLTLRRALKLEMQGIKVVKGTTAYAILKREGFTGSRKKVLAELDAIRQDIIGEKE